MNLIYLHTHDSGRWFSPYGCRVETPAIQMLAEEGAVFRQAFCAGPTCSPSRAALLTGTYPHQCGMLGLTHRGFSIGDVRRHLACYLRGKGFETVLSGVQHELAGEQVALAYQRVLHNGDCSTQEEGLTRFDRDDYRSARLAAKYLRERKKGDAPFFLSVGFVNTHRDYPDPAPDIDPEGLCPPAVMPDTAENRRDAAGLATAVRVVDRCTGIVLSALKEAGLEQDTAVLFTTDHGIAYPRMKCNLYDGGIGVALILRYPGMRAAGRTVDAMVSHLDVYPALCELAGVEKPSWLEGRSLLPLLDGEEESVRGELFAEVTFHAAYEPSRCVRTGRYKYIRRYAGMLPLPANVDDGIAKECFSQAGYFREEIPAEQLFDLCLDPGERVNLAGRPEYGEVLGELRARLADWQRRTADPIEPTGVVLLPKGACVNRPEAYSPKEPELLYGE